MKVLVADDSKLTCDRLSNALCGMAGVDEVLLEENATVAIQKSRRHHPDIMILDLQMPGGGGGEVLNSIAREEVRPLAAIILTNYAESEYRQACLERGADFFFDKSTQFEQVLRAVQKVFEGRNVIEASREEAFNDSIRLAREKEQAQALHAAGLLTLQRRNKVLSAVGFAAKRLLAEPDWMVGMREVLERLGRAAEVDYIRILRLDASETSTELFVEEYSWSRLEEYAQHWVQDFFVDRDREVRDQILCRKPLVGTRDLWGRQGWSFEIYPLCTAHEVWGAVSFETSDSRTVDGVELDALQVVAQTLSAAIFRGENESRLLNSELQLRDHVERLESSERDMQTLLEASPEGVLVVSNEDDRILFANSSAARMMGGSNPNLLIGESFRAHRDREDNQDLQLVDHGGVGQARIKQSMIHFKGARAVMVSLQDVTAERSIESDMIKANRMESVSVLAVGLAHDFNNILAAMMGNLALAREDRENRKLVDDAIDDVYRAVIRAQSLTRQLLSFSKGGSPVLQEGSLAEVIQETVEFTLAGKATQARYTLPQHLWSVNMDQGQISQVLENLAVNASQAMDNSGSLQIHAENIELDEMDVANLHALQAGKYIRLTVSDDGCGIPEEMLGRIFDPYVTSKKEGNGLGLAVTYAIIQKHGGYISVQSTLGEGTVFTIYLPATGRTKVAVPAEKPSEQTLRGEGRILVMDDEETLRRVAVKLLKRIGYDAEAVESGEDAVEAYRTSLKEGRPYAAVILDLTVPGGMGGEEACRAILAIDPTARVLVCSGYCDEEMTESMERFGFAGVIPKPYSPLELSEVLHHAIFGK